MSESTKHSRAMDERQKEEDLKGFLRLASDDSDWAMLSVLTDDTAVTEGLETLTEEGRQLLLAARKRILDLVERVEKQVRLELSENGSPVCASGPLDAPAKVVRLRTIPSLITMKQGLFPAIRISPLNQNGAPMMDATMEWQDMTHLATGLLDAVNDHMKEIEQFASDPKLLIKNKPEILNHLQVTTYLASSIQERLKGFTSSS